MLKRFLSRIALALLTTGVIICLIYAGVAGNRLRTGKYRVFKLAHSLDPSHPVSKSLVYMAEQLQNISGGTMKIDIYPGCVLGGEAEMTEQLQNGIIDMMKSSGAAMEVFIPEMKVFGLPYVFRNRYHFWTVLDGAIGRELLDKGQTKHIYGICFFDAGSRNFYTRDRAINKPEDLEGLKIRVQGSRMAMRLVETLGASPTPISFGELYSALQQGIVDGAENNLPSFFSNKHYEVCKYFSFDGHTMIPDMLIMNLNVWRNLNQQQQQWILEAAERASKYERLLWRKQTQEALKACRKLGVKFSYPDKKAFIRKVAPLLQRYEKSSVLGELLRRIRETPDKVRE
ncbi:TRAP transporter substrate-binding protein [Lentisphaerota bacterium ZTH]|nr:TRAP transporter substrate-binding protein [Lentisphaerota bacterium]WET05439.1 TRAP transporter substrate-binding protein [Lentisphaerota bacterium ZTH]